MIESVVREGTVFEAMIMNKEIDKPQFRFLFENRSPAHIYYRWKLFSVLQGDASNKWRTEDFRMFRGGSIWRPPSLNPYSQGMPDELFSSDEEDDESRRRSLSKSQKKRLELMLRRLTPEKSKVAEAMIFCIEHAEASDEIIDFITESLNTITTKIPKKLGRFFLVSDVLYNSSAKAVNASNFRSGFQSRLVEIVNYMHLTFESCESRLKAEAFKQRVMLCFRAWEDWNVYPPEFLCHLQNIFLGLVSADQEIPKLSAMNDYDVDGMPLEDPELDGAPLSDSEDLDGVPLDGAALLRSAVKLKSSSPIRAFVHKTSKYDADVDGVPMSDDLDGVPLYPSSSPSMRSSSTHKQLVKATTSKWESEAPVLASSKWDHPDLESDHQYDHTSHRKKYRDNEDIFTDADAGGGGGAAAAAGATTGRRTISDEEDLDGTPMDDSSQETIHHNSDSRNEDRRGKLRDIELKVVRYQDDLEAGNQSRVSGMTVPEQVQQYREHLLRKVMRDYPAETGEVREKENSESSSSRKDRRGDSERRTADKSDRPPRDKERSERHKEKDKRKSTSRSRSRSRSPKKSSRSKRGRSRSASPARAVRKSPRRSRSRSGSPSKRSRRSRSQSPSRKSTSKSIRKSKF